MPELTYKCVPVPTAINTGIVGKDSNSIAVSAYEALINNAAKGGWELVQIDSVSSIQKPGCLGSLIGQKPPTVNYKLLIFKKETNSLPIR